MTVDTRVRPANITITVLDADKNTLSGPHDVSDAVATDGFGLSFPQANLREPNGWLPMRGRVTLKADLGGLAGLNLDPRSATGSPSGAALLTQGNRVDIQIAQSDRITMGAVCPPLFILKVERPLNYPDRVVELSLGDETLLDGLTPEGDESGFEIGTTTNRRTIINRYLATAGIASTADSLSRYSLTAPPQKLTRNNWASEAGKIAATAGALGPWIDNTGATRLTDINLDQSAPVLSLTVGEGGDEAGPDGWLLESNDERPPARLVVTAAAVVPVEIDNPYSESRTVPGDGFTAESITVDKSWDFGTTPQFTHEVDTRRAEKLIRPINYTVVDGVVTAEANNTTTSLRDAINWRRVVDYSNLTKKITSETITEIMARGVAGGDAFRGTDGNAAALSTVQRTTTITYDYSRITGQLRQRITRRIEPWCLVPWGSGNRPSNYDINRFTERETYKATETWEEVAGNVFGGDSSARPQRWLYKREVLQPVGVVEAEYSGNNADRLVTDHNESDEIEGTDSDAQPPAPEYQDKQYGDSRVLFKGSASFTPAAGVAYKNLREVVSVGGDYVVSNAQCSFLAELMGRVRYGRANGASFVGAVPDWLFTGFYPMARLDIAVDGFVEAYALDGWELDCSSDGLFWGCGLLYLGRVGVAPEDVAGPVAIVHELNGGLTMPGQIHTGEVRITYNLSGGFTMPDQSHQGLITVPVELSGGFTMPSQVHQGLIVGPLEFSGGFTMPSQQHAGEISIIRILAGGFTMPDQIHGGDIGGPLDPDASAYIARLTGTYSQSQLDGINQLFIDLKTDGTYSKLNAAWIYAMQTASDTTLNIKGTSFTATNTGMAFSAGFGLNGGGAGQIDTTYVPSTQNTINNIAMGFWSNSNITDSSTDIGCENGSNRLIIASRFPVSPDTCFPAANSPGAVSFPNSQSDGLISISRLLSTEFKVYRGATILATLTETSTGLPTRSIFVGARNAGSPTQRSSRQYAFAYVGQGLSDSEINTLNNAVTALLSIL